MSYIRTVDRYDWWIRAITALQVAIPVVLFFLGSWKALIAFLVVTFLPRKYRIPR